MALHADEAAIDLALVRALISDQFSQWADLPLSEAGSGTDNRMFRLGYDMVIRLPRTASTAAGIAKEQAWIPRLAPHLPVETPRPLGLGLPGDGFGFPWSIYEWIQGEEPGPETVTDWTMFGRDLAGVVSALHSIDVGDATRGGALAWYRGLPLAAMAEDVEETLADCRVLSATDPAFDMDVDAVANLWRRLVDVPDPDLEQVWLHGDLRSANLLVRDGRLSAVLDFGGLSIGRATAEHAAIWEYPEETRTAYREALGLDPNTWSRALGWKLVVSLLAIPYYWSKWPDFAQGSLDQVETLLAAS